MDLSSLPVVLVKLIEGDEDPNPIPFIPEGMGCTHEDTLCMGCLATWSLDYVVYFILHNSSTIVSYDEIVMASTPQPTTLVEP